MVPRKCAVMQAVRCCVRNIASNGCLSGCRDVLWNPPSQCRLAHILDAHEPGHDGSGIAGHQDGGSQQQEPPSICAPLEVPDTAPGATQDCCHNDDRAYRPVKTPLVLGSLNACFGEQPVDVPHHPMVRSRRLIRWRDRQQLIAAFRMRAGGSSRQSARSAYPAAGTRCPAPDHGIAGYQSGHPSLPQLASVAR